MKSKRMGKRLGAMVLLLTVAGLAGPLAAADVAPPETVTQAQFEAWFKEVSNWGAGARTTSSPDETLLDFLQAT